MQKGYQIFGGDIITFQNKYPLFFPCFVIVLRCYNLTTEYLIIFLYLVAFLLPGIGYRAATFVVCKIHAFDQSNALF